MMKYTTGFVVAGMIAMTAIPAWAGDDGGVGGVDYQALSSEARVLSEEEILQLLQRSGEASNIDASNVDVQYLGAESEIAVESELCCENVNEVVTEETEVQESTTYIDAVTEREIIQPVERTLIQPVERQIIQGRTEVITEPTQYEEQVLPTIVNEDEVPAVVENVIPQETIETREDITESYRDVVTQRDVIQPIVRTTIVPVQRRVDRPQIVEETAPTRYESQTLPLQVITAPTPPVDEYTTEQVTVSTTEEYSDVYVDAVTQQDIYQPVERTIVQPIERRILQPETENVTAATQYTQEVLPTIVQEEDAPAFVENVIPQYVDRTILEVSDVYVDRVTRNVTQPVVIQKIQPVQRQVIQPRKETITAATRYETEYLPGRVEQAVIPAPIVNYIPQVNVVNREDYSESYFSAVTQRNIYQPIVHTQIQPIEIRRVNAVTETVTAPTQYETIRADMVVLNVGGGCVCTPDTPVYGVSGY